MYLILYVLPVYTVRYKIAHIQRRAGSTVAVSSWIAMRIAVISQDLDETGRDCNIGLQTDRANFHSPNRGREGVVAPIDRAA